MQYLTTAYVIFEQFSIFTCNTLEQYFQFIVYPAAFSSFLISPDASLTLLMNFLYNIPAKTFLQASNSNDDWGNNKKNSTPTLDIIEFCIFDNETLYYFEILKIVTNIKTIL